VAHCGNRDLVIGDRRRSPTTIVVPFATQCVPAGVEI